MLLSLGEDGSVLIDDSMPPFLSQLQQSLASVGAKRLDFLINTHAHGDHVGNNAAFGTQGAHIVAHENLRKYLKEKGVYGAKGLQPAPEKALPVLTFEHGMSIHLNGERLQLIHVPKAHTDGDTIVWFEKSNVLHPGDIFFNGLFPFIDLDSGGSVQGYIAAQARCLELLDENSKVVPGHGPLATREDLMAAHKMLKQSAQRIKRLVKKGLSEDEVLAQQPLADYAQDWSWGFIDTERMTRQLYQGLSSH